MASHILILIESNPKESHRACEGIRIALGLAACNINVELILSSGAQVLLTDDIDDCVDGELAKQYLANLNKFIPTIYIEKEGNYEYHTMLLNRSDIDQTIASAESVIRM